MGHFKTSLPTCAVFCSGSLPCLVASSLSCFYEWELEIVVLKGSASGRWLIVAPTIRDLNCCPHRGLDAQNNLNPSPSAH